MSKSALVQRVQDMIGAEGYTHNDRLPPERRLCEMLGVNRNQLRSALAELEAQGRIWRHIGRGTFVGARPVLNLQDVSYLCDQVKPAQVVTVRQTIEPELARLAAINGHPSDHERMQHCADRCRQAADWRGYEAWDNNLHHAIARASGNKLFIYYFDTLNVVRRSIVWGQSRNTTKPVETYSSFSQHDRIVAAIVDRDGDRAARYMREHLESVYTRILPETAG
ncbi:FadR family transcriptional regulator [Paracoccus sp. JM45]|nr:FadR family transcriptional regulator [Paracoccus sp. JM45]